MSKFIENLKEFPSTSKTFLQEVKVEWTKVTKPSRDEVMTTTIVVVITSAIFAAFLWGSDRLIIKVYETAMGLLGG